MHPIELVIDPAGRVTHVHPLDTVHGYTNAVAEAMTQWVYDPTVVNGVPVPVIVRRVGAVTALAARLAWLRR